MLNDMYQIYVAMDVDVELDHSLVHANICHTIRLQYPKY